MTASSSHTSYTFTADRNELCHRQLAEFNTTRFQPTPATLDWRTALDNQHYVQTVESEMVEAERHGVAPLANYAPRDPDQFVTWFEALRINGPGQGDTLFPWLAHVSSYEAMIWFLEQELAHETGYEDLVALTQVKLPSQPKLELARSYWDEMGRGHESGTRARLLSEAATHLGLRRGHKHVVFESLALGNLMIALAVHRRYTYHSIGALAVTELTAPERVSQVNEGLKRLQVDSDKRKYFALRSQLDLGRSRAWIGEVLRPLVVQNSQAAFAIAEGALMCLTVSARSFERYRKVLKVNELKA